MYGLIDCNNFFVSCERIFRPDVAERPVVVMSNNDGCAVAMSNEAKALGIKRGVPVYQVKELIRRHNVVTFSGNHKLYGDISARVMATVASMIPSIEVYSIDECFIDFAGLDTAKSEELARKIVRRVRRDVGVPTSLGIAPTKTLAKVAAKFAKKYPGYRAVCVIDTDEKRRKALSLTEIEDVWGIGRRVGRRLRETGIDTALKLADTPLHLLSGMLNLNGRRTWQELNAVVCVDFEPDEPDRKQICTSRSFSRALGDVEALREAIANFSDNVSRKLRRQRGCARTLNVFIQTNTFRPDLPQHIANLTYTFEEATDDTLAITRVSVGLLHAMFREGYAYKRAGVIITDIVPRNAVQRSLFTEADDRERRSRLMDAIDAINSRDDTYDKVHLATHTPNVGRRVRQDELSPLYTTRLSDVIRVKA